MTLRARSLNLTAPWMHAGALASAPRRLSLKLALGEDPVAIPTALGVRTQAAAPAESVDGGAIDRILRKHGDRARVVRVHQPASALRRPGASAREFDELEHVTGLSRTFRVELGCDCHIGELADDLRQLSRVDAASPMYLCATPFAAPAAALADDEAAWRTREQIGAAEAMAYEPGDPAVILAIVDTGVRADHPELARQARSGVDTVQIGAADIATGMRLLGDSRDIDNDPSDDVGHGTACAGIAAARGEGCPPGLAGACGVLPIRVLAAAQAPGHDAPVGIGCIPDIDAGVKWAIDLGAHVINMSFGTQMAALDPEDAVPHADVVRYGAARGRIMIAASGNSGRREAYTPAALDGVIAVGSVGANGEPSSFSTSGDHVALCAPGEGVVSTSLEGYGRVTGTSFAAPFVAAAAALLASRSLRRSRPASPDLIARALVDSARPWQGRGRSEAGAGKGVLDVHAALRYLDRLLDEEDAALAGHPAADEPPEEASHGR